MHQEYNFAYYSFLFFYFPETHLNKYFCDNPNWTDCFYKSSG